VGEQLTKNNIRNINIKYLITLSILLFYNSLLFKGPDLTSATFKIRPKFNYKKLYFPTPKVPDFNVA